MCLCSYTRSDGAGGAGRAGGRYNSACVCVYTRSDGAGGAGRGWWELIGRPEAGVLPGGLRGGLPGERGRRDGHHQG